MSDLLDSLLDAGLIQFGDFQQGDKHSLYALRLDLMPSYPAVLARAALHVGVLIDKQPSRLVCTQDAVALATLISQTMQIPLVVHNGTLGHPAHNLVGAYDVGHAAVLISLTTDYSAGFIEQLSGEAAGVGLHISQWVSLIGVKPVNELRHVAAIDLRDVAEYLVERGELSAHLGAQLIRAD